MSTQHFVYEFAIPEQLAGRKLKSVLQSEYKFSTRLLRSLIPHQAVWKNEELAYLNQPVHEGDIIKVMLPKEGSEVPAESMPIDVRYEDEEIIVVNKPPGVLTHPTARERNGSMLAGVAYHLKAEGAVPHSVHRLDRDTSGVVMFAKHAHIHHLFDIALRAGQMHRTYCALVWHKDAFNLPQPGVWETIDLPIGMDPHRPSRRIITASGQRAVTHYRVLAQSAEVSAVEVRLETGRTHQIRLHFAAVGMPLVGDASYGAPGAGRGGAKHRTGMVAETFRRQALHAVHLTWRHPVTGREKTATAPVASDIKTLWGDLSGDPSVWGTVESMGLEQSSGLS